VGCDSLTRREIEVVQGDWEKVEREPQSAAALLYERLFWLDPGMRKLFEADLVAHRRKIVNFIGAALQGLAQPELLLPIVQHLGRKHRRFRVRNQDYATFGAALLWMLKELHGSAFGPENAAAWANVYEVLADAMRAMT
jgi:hemoglobin-like flavoprotein